MNSVQPVKSTIVNPVVVNIDTTLKRADLKVSSAYELSIPNKVKKIIRVNITVKKK